MNEKQKGWFKVFSPYVIFFITLVGFWFTLTNNLQSKTEAEAQEQKTLQTFEMVQQQFTLLKRDSKIERLNIKIDYLTKHKYELRDQLRKYPNDTDIQTELNEVNADLNKAKEELKTTLGN